ncbi:HAD family phosphatase [Aerophototrophica crusticola]|uniref:HAD family phosphatase n=1 Tax=Aerophototrophica crusticola TaxID=1709002 RepID=A0A858R9G2_9PROT|nr:HAD family phosphatase [Rhodospirillaceae bacterium B3]
MTTLPRLPRPVHAVVFDMDGLLIDTERHVRAATFAAADSVGKPMDEGFYATVIGTPWPETWARLKGYFGEQGVRDFRAAFEGEIRTHLREITLMAGVAELLDHLDAAGLPMAVATSTGRAKAVEHLGKVGILERFRVVITRDEVQNGKPHPEPYLKAAAALGMDPAHCLALEDSHNGIRAAHAAGMMAVMVPDLLPATEEIRGLCLHVADDLHGVRALLAGI